MSASNYLSDMDKRILPSFEQSIKECQQYFDLGVSSRFDEAIDKLREWSPVSIYHAHTQMNLSTMKHMLTLDKSDVNDTLELGEYLINLCDKNMKSHSLVSSVRHIFTAVDYNQYTDIQIQAILIKAMVYTLMGGSVLVSDNTSLMNLVKGAFRLQSSHSIFNQCDVILKNRINWESEASKNYFLSGLYLNQAFNALILSHFPNRVMKFLSWIGFDCDREKALDMIDTVSKLRCGFYGTAADIALGLYECVVVPVFGARAPNCGKILDIVDRELGIYPQSSWALLFKALALKLNGDIDNAIIHYNLCIESQKDLYQLHNLCYWDLSFCYGLKLEWDDAARCADKLFGQCNWSVATFAYMKGAFLYMKMIDQNEPELKAEVSQLFREIPKLKQRFAGKTIPPENYVCVNAQKYFTQNESLQLPAFDLFYIWNMYANAANNPKLLDPIVARIDKSLQDHYEKREMENLYNFSLLRLIKGICLKYQGHLDRAQDCIGAIFTAETNLAKEKSLLAMASLEMGLIWLSGGDGSEAMFWLKKAQKYRTYYFKSIIHFRAHSAIQKIKQMKKE